MNYAIIKLVAVIGAIYSLLAALIAYIITYQEYIRHFPDNRVPRKMALRAAVAAFVFFMLLSLSAGYLFTKIK